MFNMNFEKLAGGFKELNGCQATATKLLPKRKKILGDRDGISNRL